MFQKLVYGLIHSPSLASEVEVYEKKLKKDLFWQKSGSILMFIFMAAVIVTESFPAKVNTINSQPVHILAAKDFSLNVKSTNISKKSDAVSAGASNIINYELSATNNSQKEHNFTFLNYINDITEYAEIFDTGGASVKEDNIVWPEALILPGETQTRSFSIKVRNPIPINGPNSSISTSYDCVMSNNFGNTINTPVSCSPIINVANLTTFMPSVDVNITIITSVILFIISLILTIRTKLLLREISAIRKNYITGAI